jgi:hypothetical protein
MGVPCSSKAEGLGETDDNAADARARPRVPGKIRTRDTGLRAVRFAGLENFRQIRPTVGFGRPLCSAIDFRDQWVATFGIASSVAITTASI